MCFAMYVFWFVELLRTKLYYRSGMNVYRKVSRMVAESIDENIRINTELFVVKVWFGNRPNTHLTPNAFEEVAFSTQNKNMPGV